MLVKHGVTSASLAAVCLLAAACSDSSTLAGLLGAAAAAGNSRTSAFSQSFQRYRQQPPNKALVLARGDPFWAWGWAANDATMDRAMHTAMEHCEHARLDRHITAPCRVYAINDEVVADYTRPALKQALSRFESVNLDSIR